MIRFILSNLDGYLSEIENDINKFHKYVKVLIDNLHAKGETTHDLLANLFKAYAAYSDQTFAKYMSNVQTRWEDDKALRADVKISSQLQDSQVQRLVGSSIRTGWKDYSTSVGSTGYEEEAETEQGKKEKRQ